MPVSLHASANRPAGGTIWVDITELFDWFLVANHPTGVSRVVAALKGPSLKKPETAELAPFCTCCSPLSRMGEIQWGKITESAIALSPSFAEAAGV